MIAAELVRAAQQAFSSEADPSSASVALAFSAVALLPLAGVVPMTLLCLAVAARLPPWPAAGVILLGSAANTVLAWTLARGVLGARVQDWLRARGGWLGAVAEGARREPLKWAFLARYVPAPFIAAPMALSTAGVGLGTTLAGTLLGMAPWAAVYVYAAHAGREASVTGFGRAALALLLGYVLLRLMRRRLRPRPAVEPALKPRAPGLPLIRLFTLPGQDLSDEARRDLAALRDPLGFEVEEILLSPDGTGEGARYLDHAPVALLMGERLFSYQVDENVLRERLERSRRRENP